jgi:type I restriction enzyme R subunit
VKFGTFIHKYLHKEAVDDKVILDLQYEARDVEQAISSKDKLDKKKDDITKGLTQERKEKIEDRWATLEKVYSSKERIERIGYSIINDVESGMLKYDWCNAMLVAGDIYSAYKYYEFFQNICSDTILKDRCAVVTSYNPTDYDLRKQKVSAEAESRNQFKNKMANQSYADAGVKNSEEYEKKAKDLFIHKPAVMKLLIVVDKLLTGFDAPSATYLYIDKEMKDHTLFQALCRVNRLGVNVEDAFGNVVFTKKEYGLIVDFKHLFGKIENAITVFNDSEGGLGNFDEEDLEGLLTDAVAKNQGILKARLNSYLALKGEWESLGLWADNRDERLENLARYYTTDQEGIKAEELRQTMYLITSQFVAAYNNIADFMNKAGYSQDEAENIERLAKEAACINRYIKQQ